MAWPTPKYSRNQVNRSGKTLCLSDIEPLERRKATAVLNNWRSCHGYPINTFQSTLRDKLRSIDPHALVAQRLKRTPSIVEKLRRFHGMQLARMQDIGGLRAVVKSLTEIRELEKNYKNSRFAHELIDVDDYIANPKASGYRSIHMIYRYKNPIRPEYDGLLLELQIRSRLQHAWATAVETMGTFLNHALKSSEGPDEWLDFFALAGSGFSYLEDGPPVPCYEFLSKKETFSRITREATRLEVKHRLIAFTAALRVITDERHAGSYHLIVLDPIKRTVTLSRYSQKRLDEANKEYTRQEHRIHEGESIQVVLVSAGPIDALKRAYPNYFLDTREFIAQLDCIENEARQNPIK